jgi:hypothetical protein
MRSSGTTSNPAHNSHNGGPPTGAHITRTTNRDPASYIRTRCAPACDHRSRCGDSALHVARNDRFRAYPREQYRPRLPPAGTRRDRRGRGALLDRCPWHLGAPSVDHVHRLRPRSPNSPQPSLRFVRKRQREALLPHRTRCARPSRVPTLHLQRCAPTRLLPKPCVSIGGGHARATLTDRVHKLPHIHGEPPAEIGDEHGGAITQVPDLLRPPARIHHRPAPQMRIRVSLCPPHRICVLPRDTRRRARE